MAVTTSLTEPASKQAAQDLREVATKVEDAATAQFDRLEKAIRRNPIAATGIAAGIGFALAVLARR